MGYADVFGGSSVQPADVQFCAVALTGNLVTVWPPFATTGNQMARIMQVTPSAGGFSVMMPDATLTSAGIDVIFDNPGAFTFTVLDYAGGVICTVAAGQVKYLYLSDSSTSAGTWRVTLFGAASSTLDAAQLAGYGLKAISGTLNTAPTVVGIFSDTTVLLTDRAKVFVWSGGSGNMYLPATAGSTSDFVIEVHNQGTGVLTVSGLGGALIDGSSSIALSINESCFLHMGATAWYTVGRGRNTQFNFTQLNKVVTGGSVSLTLTEASNVVQNYTGTLTSNQTVVLPSVVQVYYIRNSTSGSYTLTFSCLGGTTVIVIQSQTSILFCDGTNVVNANTSLVGGITGILFGNGSASAPSAAFGTVNTGLYATATSEIGISTGGVLSSKFSATGAETLGSGAMSYQVVSSANSATSVVDRPAGSVGSFRLLSSGLDRWSFDVTSVVESGSNAGSGFALNAYSDTGALLGSVLTVDRATRLVTMDAVTQSPGDNTTKVATTAFAAGKVSPAFTGIPTAPTAAFGTSTTQLATTAFVAGLAFSAALPAQAGNAGKTITTDGVTASWVPAGDPNYSAASFGGF